jgi:hypothetical protein
MDCSGIQTTTLTQGLLRMGLLAQSVAPAALSHGGIIREQNYTAQLLYCYFLTGDTTARRRAGLADC